MKPGWRFAAFLFGALLAAWPAPAQNAPAQNDPAQTDAAPADADAGAGWARLKVELTPTQITVGDRVRAELTLVWMGPEPSSAPRFPAWQDRWGNAEVLSAGEVEAFTDQSGRRIYKQVVTVTAFSTGEVTVPAAVVAVPLAEETREVRSEPATFTVVSVLPDTAQDGEGDADTDATPDADAPDDAAPDAAGGAGDADADADASLVPKPPAPPEELATGYRFLWTALALAALCAVAGFRLGRWEPATPAARVDPARLLPPLDELLFRLRHLDPTGGAEPAHTGLSLALRTFLGRALAFPAVESTTSEIQRRLRHAPVTAATAQRTVSLLRDCDRVKFARLDVGPAETGERLRHAESLAREIDAAVRPVVPAAANDTAAEAAS